MIRITDRATEMIADRIAPDQRIMRARLLTLEPLEAISLLGALVADTLERFPAKDQPGILAAFCAELLGLPDREDDTE